MLLVCRIITTVIDQYRYTVICIQRCSKPHNTGTCMLFTNKHIQVLCNFDHMEVLGIVRRLDNVLCVSLSGIYGEHVSIHWFLLQQDVCVRPDIAALQHGAGFHHGSHDLLSYHPRHHGQVVSYKTGKKILHNYACSTAKLVRKDHLKDQ